MATSSSRANSCPARGRRRHGAERSRGRSAARRRTTSGRPPASRARRPGRPRGGRRRARGRSRTATGPGPPGRRRPPRAGSGRRAAARSRGCGRWSRPSARPPPRWRTSWPTSHPAARDRGGEVGAGERAGHRVGLGDDLGAVPLEGQHADDASRGVLFQSRSTIGSVDQPAADRRLGRERRGSAAEGRAECLVVAPVAAAGSCWAGSRRSAPPLDRGPDREQRALEADELLLLGGVGQRVAVAEVEQLQLAGHHAAGAPAAPARRTSSGTAPWTRTPRGASSRSCSRPPGGRRSVATSSRST